MTGRPPSTGAYLAQLLGLFTIYVLTAKIGLGVDAVAGFAAAVWPPTGIAIAALWLAGYRLWPALAAGAFVTNYTGGATVVAASGMAAGNTLEAVVAVFLLRRVVDFDARLERLSDALGLILLAGVASTPISATVGVASGWLGGVIASADAASAWQTWWAGDLLGALVVAPLLLTWLSRPLRRPLGVGLPELAAFTAAVLAASVTVFGRAPGAPLSGAPHLLFPFVVWAAVRFGPRGAAATIFAVSTAAIVGTAAGSGPFQEGALTERLLALQVFMAVIASTGLVLASVSAERELVTRELEESLQGKVALLREVHHRVKNNLQVISSLLRLQSVGLDDARTVRALKDSQERVRAMALVHERLHRSGHSSQIEIVAYAQTLLVGLVQSYGLEHTVRVVVDSDPLEVSIDTAIPCGLILQELASNALKHAFTDERGGSIAVDFRRLDDGRVRFSVADDGPGLPEGVGLDAGSSMGFKIIRALVGQLGGTAAVVSDQGARFEVTFRERDD